MNTTTPPAPGPAPAAAEDALPAPALPRGLRVAVLTLGCRLNIAESDLIRRRLEGAGHRVVDAAAPADVCVVNSCTVTAQADAKSRQALRALRRRNPGARVVATGCYAQRDPGALAAPGLADLVVGNEEKLNLAAYLADEDADERAPAGEARPRIVAPRLSRAPFVLGGFDAGALVTTGGGTRAHLKIQDGCDFMCTFCVIPAVRGRARARALDDLRAEAEALAAGGVRELVLTGVNLGTYDSAQGDLVRVVDVLDALPGLARIRISSIEPTTVAPPLLERMADPAHRLVPFLHLPLQSGSAAVLAAMRRRYAPADYRAFAERALARVPELCLGSDVMAGFPGESDGDFEETLALLDDLPFAYCHVFPFSARSGTPGARLAAQAPVPAPLRKRRAAALRALGEAKQIAYHRRFLGRTLPVLFEQPARPGEAQGYTANYIRVAVPAAAPGSLRNRILPVRLLEAGVERMAGALAEADGDGAARPTGLYRRTEA